MSTQQNESETQTRSRRKKTGNGLKLGIFTVAGILLFIGGIYFVGKNQHLFSTVFRVKGIFQNVNGLQVGNSVRFSGIIVGSVDNIKIITDTSVQVEMIIDEETRRFIKKDAMAVIGSDGLMGNKIINITPGTCTEKEIGDNEMIATVKPLNMDEIWSQLKKTSDNAANITTDLSEIIGGIRNGKGTIGKLLADSSLVQNLNQTLVTIKKGAKGFQENMDAAQHSFLLKGIFKKKNKAEKEKIKVKEKSSTGGNAGGKDKLKNKDNDGEKKTRKERRQERRAARKEKNKTD